MLDCTQAWQAVLGELELLISKPNFTTWFKGSGLLSFDEQSAVVCVPNTFTKSWLEQKYHQHIVRALHNVTQIRIRQVVYRVEVVRMEDRPLRREMPVAAAAIPTSPVEYPTESSATTAAKESPVVNQFGLNQKYLFETFIVGKSSELAHAACQAVASAVIDSRQKPYNPLFVYGGVGLGKTHLLQGVGNRVLKSMPHARIRYVTCEQFM
ncbi:hypothetical protein HY632_04645, partial [Candidatus Uhrbacteria bacterium]|nr:hypothetical protein [Candidatus Uhrbacteria bacterium]